MERGKYKTNIARKIYTTQNMNVTVCQSILSVYTADNANYFTDDRKISMALVVCICTSICRVYIFVEIPKSVNISNIKRTLKVFLFHRFIINRIIFIS